MAETTPAGEMDDDLRHLEENLHRLAAVARTLARDVDAIDAQTWNEPYAYHAANAAIRASRNLRRQLEARWLVSPLETQRPEELNSPTSTRSRKKSTSYPHVIETGVNPVE